MVCNPETDKCEYTDVVCDEKPCKTQLCRHGLAQRLDATHLVEMHVKAASREFQIGLVSMANLAEVGYVFQRANLTPLFTVIMTAEDASVCKPAPDCCGRAPIP